LQGSKLLMVVLNKTCLTFFLVPVERLLSNFVLNVYQHTGANAEGI